MATSVTIEFDVNDPVLLDSRKLHFDLGHGVTLSTQLPQWVERINGAKLHLILDVEGSPSAQSDQSPIKPIHKTPTNGGQ